MGVRVRVMVAPGFWSISDHTSVGRLHNWATLSKSVKERRRGHVCY